MGIFDVFKKNKDFYEVTETNVVLRNKKGDEIASGFIWYALFSNKWEKEYEDYQRQEEETIIFHEGKRIKLGDGDDEYHYDSTDWDEEREIEVFKSYEEGEKFLNKITTPK